MNTLSHLEPVAVFSYFEELCAIPHGSGNTAAISDYCVDFAKKHDLWHRKDSLGNVIIKKPATKGKENSPPVIIQGHLDMVCEKDPSLTDLDMSKDALRLVVSGDDLYAKGTTLGGDDGIAVAFALAVLASSDLPHPPLEVIFTVDEEIGLLGAAAIDLSDLEGRRLLNIDSEEEGIFLTSCAGGLSAHCTLPVTRASVRGTAFTISLNGLKGGHSGVEIDKNRGNANLLLNRFLVELSRDIPFSLVSFEGGLKENAIPLSSTAVIVAAGSCASLLEERVLAFHAIFRKEYQTSDAGVTLKGESGENGTYFALTPESTKAVLTLLLALPGGILGMSAEIPGLVESSLNLGILKLEEQLLTARFAVRSSLQSRKEEMVTKLSVLCEAAGGSVSISGDYPAWEYQKQSTLREVMVEAYQDLFGKEPKLAAVHAGLECGFLAGKVEDLDCISFGPDLFDIHTTKERLSISSTKRTYDLLCEVLKRL